MPELALLRHAKSDWSASLPDRERPSTPAADATPAISAAGSQKPAGYPT